MIIKTEEEKKFLREAGKHLREVLEVTAEKVRPGVSTLELNEVAQKTIESFGDTPAFLHYTPHGAPRPYPATLCIAHNETVVHGIPTEDPIELIEGDIIGLDTGLWHEGFVVDSGITVPVGKISAEAEQLLKVTEKALHEGIKAARAGNRVGDIGHAIETFVKPYGYGIVKELCGHGVGKAVHEEPQVPNYGKSGRGAKLVPGMVIAIEPMLNIGSEEVVFEDDGYTVRTKDGSLSAHFEHTLVITEGEPEILTDR